MALGGLVGLTGASSKALGVFMFETTVRHCTFTSCTSTTGMTLLIIFNDHAIHSGTYHAWFFLGCFFFFLKNINIGPRGGGGANWGICRVLLK